MAGLPSGTVTFLFTDIEGSTKLVEQLGVEFPRLLEDHVHLIREKVESHGGVIVRTMGDGVFAAFPDAVEAVAAAVDAQRSLASHPWPQGVALRVRMGLHAGRGILGGDDYVGVDVHRAARVSGLARGDQIVISDATRALVKGKLAEDVSLMDLGRHRLRDLLDPDHLYQVVAEGLPAEFPPLESLTTVPNNLPVELTSFIGREADMERVVSLFEATRLVTLTGPGGVGKTRLAIHVAAELLERFPDGVFIVDLSPIRAPELLASMIAGVQSVRLEVGGPDQSSRSSLEERLANHLSDKRMLLILDNFEQLLEAGPLISELLFAAPELAVLATSRAALRLRGEQQYPLEPLTLPDERVVGDRRRLLQSPSVRLFLERATSVDPDFELSTDNADAVAEITKRLDGLPLAIELAASRIGLVPPPVIAEQLRSGSFAPKGPRDLPDRQRTIRATIDWSHDLLTDDARVLFRRMAVFTGGAPMSAIFEVCESSDDRLEELLEHSLVRDDPSHGRRRVRMLETIGEAARDRLHESRESELMRDRHAQWFLGLAEEARPHLDSRERVAWLERLEVEHDNLRAAAEWFIEREQPDHAFRFLRSIWRFWQMRGHLREAAGLAERILELTEGDLRLRAAALTAAGGLAYWRGEIAAARALYEESLSYARSSGDKGRIAAALYDLSFAYAAGHSFIFGAGEEPDFSKAYAAIEESQSISRELGDEEGMARTRFAEGGVAYWAGELERSREAFEDALEHSRRVGDPAGTRDALSWLAGTLFRLGDLTGATANCEEALELIAEEANVLDAVLILDLVASIAVARGKPDRALTLMGAVERLRHQSGTGLDEHTHIDRQAASLRTVDSETADALIAKGEEMDFEEAIAYALGE